MGDIFRFKMFGVPVKLNITLLIPLLFFGSSGLATNGITGFFQAVLFVGTLYLLILLHEFGHSFAAKFYGYKTKEIILHVLGGVAFIEGMEDLPPKEEMVVSAAGPFVNFILGIPSLTLAVISLLFEIEFLGKIFFTFGVFNLAIMLLNLVPMFPLDGGRFLKGFLSLFMPKRHTMIIISALGTIIGLVFMIVGAMNFYLGFLVIGAICLLMNFSQLITLKDA